MGQEFFLYVFKASFFHDAIAFDDLGRQGFAACVEIRSKIRVQDSTV